MATLTSVRIVMSNLKNREITFLTDMPYRRVVLRVLGILRDMRSEHDCRAYDAQHDYAAKRICAEIAHYAVFPGDDVVGDFHCNVNLADDMVYIGHNEDTNSHGNLRCGGHTENIDWEAGDDSTGQDWLELMCR